MLTKCKPEPIRILVGDTGIDKIDNAAWHFIYDILRAPLLDAFEEIQMYQEEMIRRIYVKQVA